MAEVRSWQKWTSPVNPADRHLLGMQWKGKIYVDAALSFGLRSVPKIFTVLADAATWGLRSLGIRYVDHYLDDWITIGSPGSSECEENCALMTATFDRKKKKKEKQERYFNSVCH